MPARRILVDWLIELFEELQLPSHALLAGVHAVDRYLSAVAVHKESLQLVGAVSLMLCSNNYCKLLAQDGDPPELRGLATADDVVYWTDNTYTIDEVTAMEAKLMIVRTRRAPRAPPAATGAPGAHANPSATRARARSPADPRRALASGWAGCHLRTARPSII